MSLPVLPRAWERAIGYMSLCGSGGLGDITVTAVESQEMPSGRRMGYNGGSSSEWSGDEIFPEHSGC